MSDWVVSLGSAWKASTVNFLFFFAAYSIGQGIVFRLWKKILFPQVLLSIIVGCNLMAIIFFFLSLLGTFRYIPPICFMIICTIPLLFRYSEKLRKKFEYRLPSIHFEVLLLLMMVSMFLGASLSLPIGWDELVYHQTIVQRWIGDGFPVVYPDLPYSAFPSANSFIFWMLADSGTVIAPRLFIWICWVLSILACFSIIEGTGLTRLKTAVIVISFALSETVLFVVCDAFVEMIILLNVAGIFLVISHTDTKTRFHSETAILCGIMAGGAASIKLTGAIIFVIPIFWFLNAGFFRESPWKNVIKATVLLCGVGLLIAMPFYIRPLIATGNPVYPYFWDLFSGSLAQVEMSDFHHQLGAARFGHIDVLMFVMAPFSLASSANSFDGNYGWQFFVIFILAVVAMIIGRKRAVYFLGAASFGLYLFWFFTAQQSRFFLPGVFVLYISAGIGISGMKRIFQNGIIGIIFVLTIISLPLEDFGYYYQSWAQLLGKTRTIDYLHIGTGSNFLPAVEAVFDLTPRDSKLVVIFEHRIFYIPRETVIITPYFQEEYFTPIEEFQTVSALAEEFRETGADYLLVARHPSGPDELTEYFGRQQQFVQNLRLLVPIGMLKEVWRSPDYSLLKVNLNNLPSSYGW